MNKTNINYGVIGAGHIGKYHINQIKLINDVKLIGIYDINYDYAKKVAQENKTTAFKNINELLQKCDAVTIATPASTHFQLSQLVIKSKLHLFIEKPFVTTVEEAQHLIALSKQYNVKLQIGHIERFNPVFTYILNQSKPMNPKFIESHRLTPFNIRGTDIDVILDLMIHDLDLILCLIQDSVKSIHATGVNILTDSLDLVNTRIEFNKGCVANITASRISNKQMRKMRIFEPTQYTSLDFQNNSIDQYIISSNTNNNSKGDLFTLKDKSVNHNAIEIPQTNALYEELVSFIMSIIHSKKIKVSGDAGKKAIELAIAIRKQIEN